MFQFGMWPDHRVTGNSTFRKSLIRIDGELNLQGHVIIGNGSSLNIEKGAQVVFGNNCFFGHNTMIYSASSISFADSVLVSWDCQFYDTDFHYLKDEEGRIKRNNKPIVVGEGVWIGNRVSLQKGAAIADNSVVASNSLVNRVFYEDNQLIAGVPAISKSLGKKWTRDFTLEKKADEFFAENPETFFCSTIRQG